MPGDFLNRSFLRHRVLFSNARMRKPKRLSFTVSLRPAPESVTVPSPCRHRREVEDMVALDVALRRNDRDWFETLPDEMASRILHKLYYGHFFCHVVHQDYIVRKGHNTLKLEHQM